MDRQADVVVIGGGIIGCAAAYYLAKRGVNVVLIEKGDVAGEQSSRNWGFVRQQGRDAYELPLMVESNRLWRDLERELGAQLDWVQAGNLKVAEDERRMGVFRQWLSETEGAQLDTKLLDGDEVAALIPEMERRWAGALFTPSDGHAEPTKVTQAFCRAAAALGARVYTHCAAQEIRTSDGAVSAVVTENGEIRTANVICAAGTWSARLARPLGLGLPIRWVRGTVMRTTRVAPLTKIAVWTPTVAFRQRADGSFDVAAVAAADFDLTTDALRHVRLFLPGYWKNRHQIHLRVGRVLLDDITGLAPWSARRRERFAHVRVLDPAPNAWKVSRALAEFRRIFPQLRDLRVATSWAGYMDITPDAVPVLGPVERPRGFIFATGFSGHGFGLGPIVGRLVSEIVVDGKPSLDLHALRFARFNEGDFGAAHTVV